MSAHEKKLHLRHPDAQTDGSTGVPACDGSYLRQEASGLLIHEVIGPNDNLSLVDCVRCRRTRAFAEAPGAPNCPREKPSPKR